jgi:hypothetical protein
LAWLPRNVALADAVAMNDLEMGAVVVMEGDRVRVSA